MLTPEDRAEIAYFILEKGDITCWCDFEAKKHLIRDELPDLWHALTKQARWNRLVCIEVERIDAVRSNPCRELSNFSHL